MNKTFKRTCPRCGCNVWHTTKRAAAAATRKGSPCLSCRPGHKRSWTAEQLEANRQRMLGNKINVGRKHKPETIEKMKAARAKQVFSEESIEKMRLSGCKRWGTDPDAPKVNRQLRRSERYKNWAKAVKEEAKYICNDCGDSKTKKHSHHIKPVCKHPENIFDLDNGVCLCIPCHKQRHRKGWIEDVRTNL